MFPHWNRLTEIRHTQFLQFEKLPFPNHHIEFSFNLRDFSNIHHPHWGSGRIFKISWQRKNFQRQNLKGGAWYTGKSLRLAQNHCLVVSYSWEKTSLWRSAGVVHTLLASRHIHLWIEKFQSALTFWRYTNFAEWVNDTLISSTEWLSRYPTANLVDSTDNSSLEYFFLGFFRWTSARPLLRCPLKDHGAVHLQDGRFGTTKLKVNLVHLKSFTWNVETFNVKVMKLLHFPSPCQTGCWDWPEIW